jgi:predicted esterase
VHPLGVARGRDGLLRVPAGHDPAAPAPLVVALHGAGSDARGGLAPLAEVADDAGLVLLAPESRSSTWDAILGAPGPDVAFLDAALRRVFGLLAVDPARLAVSGFSDGASYALSLGLDNGDGFARVVAFSPGFVAAQEPRGRPPVFVSHGVHDAVLPIERCSRRLVPGLRQAGYDVTYEEFDGGHAVPREVARAAASWLS